VYLVNPTAFFRGNRGATTKQIEKLEKQHYKEGTLQDDDTKCSICLTQYEEGDNLRYLPCTPIKHHFHQNCIDEWLQVNRVCPICKRDITGSDSHKITFQEVRHRITDIVSVGSDFVSFSAESSGEGDV